MTSRPTHWDELERRLQAGPSPELFAVAACHGRPEPVRRYLRAAIAEGTPLAAGARLHMCGSIRLSRWLPFRANQILAPHLGTVWAARVGGVISGSDRYLDGQGGMEWKVFGRWRVMSAEGADVTRSAAGRVAGESVWVPTALVDGDPARMRALDDDTFMVQLQVGTETIEMTHRIDRAGRLRSLSFLRWGDPDRTGVWGLHPFGLEATTWRSFGGVTVPSEGRVGWHFGTPRWPEGEFFRFAIDRYDLIHRPGDSARLEPSMSLGEDLRPCRRPTAPRTMDSRLQ